MDKVIGAIILLTCTGIAVIAAKFGDRLIKKLEKDEIEHSKKVAEEMEKAFKKVVFQSVQDSFEKTVGFKKSRHGNNARY